MFNQTAHNLLGRLVRLKRVEGSGQPSCAVASGRRRRRTHAPMHPPADARSTVSGFKKRGGKKVKLSSSLTVIINYQLIGWKLVYFQL